MAALVEMGVTQDFRPLRSTAKRHHFVPQLLLRGFSHEYRGHDHLFQTATTGDAAPQRIAVRRAASRHKLYTGPDEDGQPSNRNEGYLAFIETHAGPALGRLIDDPGRLSPGDRATIAVFIAVQTMRTPAAAQQITTVANAAFRLFASEHFSDREAFAERYRERFGDRSEDEIEQFRQEICRQIRAGEVRLSGENGAAFATGLEQAISNVPPLIAFDWTLLRAPNGGFVTSDRSYAIHDPTPPFPWAAQGLLSSEASETTVPLSVDACLLVRPATGACGMSEKELTPSEVEAINLRTYGWADRYLYARDQDTIVAVHTAANRHPENVVRPKPFSQVALLEPDPDDDSLIRANLSRGWPPQVPNASGVLHDYVVIPTDEPHQEQWELVDKLAERRARKRAGVGPNDPFEGHVTSNLLHPLDILDPQPPSD